LTARDAVANESPAVSLMATTGGGEGDSSSSSLAVWTLVLLLFPLAGSTKRRRGVRLSQVPRAVFLGARPSVIDYSVVRMFQPRATNELFLTQTS